MDPPATALVGFVAVAHVGILAKEMFLWRRPKAYRRLGYNQQQQADKVATLVAPQLSCNGLQGSFLLCLSAERSP